MNKYQFQSQTAQEVPRSELRIPSWRSEDSEPETRNPELVYRPRVLMVGMHLTRTRGGITTLTRDILNSGLKETWDFTYIASQAEDFGKIRKGLLALTAGFRFAGFCLLKRPALVYVHVGSNASLYRESFFILLAKLFRRRVLAHFHAGDIDEYYPNQSAAGKRFISRALGMSDTIIAVTRESVRQLRSIVPSAKVALIPNVIDTSAFTRPGAARRKNRDPVRLLFVGATGKLKGENNLIEALAIANKANLNVKASFLGYAAEGLAARCDELGIGGLIEYLGPVSMDKRISFYHEADIFILPTYAEAMPISVIEAMAAGLPIISTPVGGIPDLVDDGREGFLVPAGDVTALAEKIGFLVRNPDERLAMGKKALQKALREMDFKAYIKKLGTEITRIGEPQDAMNSKKLFLKRSIKSAASVVKLGYPRTPPGSINIFAYHRVVADISRAERDAIYGIVISTATFRSHCEMLRQAYDIVSLETAMEYLDGKRQSQRPLAVITFDDGYLDFFEQAFPVLLDLGLPATVFVPTAYIGQKLPLAHDRIFWLLKQAGEKSIDVIGALKRSGVDAAIIKQFLKGASLLKSTDLLAYLPDALREKIIVEMEREIGDRFDDYPKEYQLLDWEMIGEMARKRIDFGSHTSNHVVLTREDGSVIKKELEDSRAELEKHLGKSIVSIAYPNGEHNADIRAFTAQAGYTIAVTTAKRINGPNADLFALGRTSLCEESTRGLSGRFSPRVANLRLGI